MRGIGASVFLLALAATAAAQDQQLGARTKAMGGSYTAFEDDPVSVWLNPAGIATQPDQASISYQTYTAYPTSSKAGPANTQTFSVDPEITLAEPVMLPAYLGFVFQLGTSDNPMSIGFCFARPYLLDYAMDQITSSSQTTFQPQNEMKESLSRFRIAFAKDFLIQKKGEAGFLTHVAVGLGLDIGYESWEFSTPTSDKRDSAVALGFGAGLLVGVYDDQETFKMNLGFAYQSAVHYDFGIDPALLPAFDMPQQFNVGMTFYMLKGLPLRATVDLQFIQWKDTALEPAFSNHPGFENVVNYSIGFEYRLPVNDKIVLYPRLGYRRFDAPWADKNNLPATGSYKLVLNTKGEAFNIVTFGAGISWTNEGGKVRSVDIAADAGGDTVNVAVGYTHEF